VGLAQFEAPQQVTNVEPRSPLVTS
jgi:hypothetical protein